METIMRPFSSHLAMNGRFGNFCGSNLNNIGRIHRIDLKKSYDGDKPTKLRTKDRYYPRQRGKVSRGPNAERAQASLDF